MWKSKELFDERVKPTATYDNSLTPSLNYIGIRARIKFHGQCLIQYKVSFTHKNEVNIYIVYEINLCAYKQSNDFALENSLFGAFS